MAGATVLPAKSPIGPPAPAYFAWLARMLMIGLLAMVGHWVQAYLGGVSCKPTPDGKGGNDTSKLFNWHPVLMTLAFGVFMAEALLAYQAPILSGLGRPTRKKVHATLHTLALFCAGFGVLVAFKSHTLKLPTPMANLYSPHSVLGFTTFILMCAQVVGGLSAYCWPQASLPVRLALGPVHKFSGKLIWVCGLATMATGLQEKTTFIQMGKGLSGSALFDPIIRLPALSQLVIVLLGAVVLFHQVPAARAVEDDKQARQGLLTPDEDDV